MRFILMLCVFRKFEYRTLSTTIREKKLNLLRSIVMLCFALMSGIVFAQQITDESFSLNIQTPAFISQSGPVLCIDEAHNNFHTIDGNYKAFANLVRSDGYTAIGFNENFSVSDLSVCNLLIISNAIGEDNKSGGIDWSYPHQSAFNRSELRALTRWIDLGGNLLLIADHAPMAGAASGLGAVIGIVMADVYADGNPAGNDIFSKSDNTLHQHSILEGRNISEAIDSIMTFTGQPVKVTEGWDPLISFGPAAMGSIDPFQTTPEFNDGERLLFSIAGWTHGAAREFGLGRIVFLGEAAMCTAQLAGPDQSKMGMNNPEASQNAQFCLNVVHWLTRVID